MSRKFILSLAGLSLAALLPMEQGQAALITPTGGNLQASVFFGFTDGTLIRSESTVTLIPSSFSDGSPRTAIAEAPLSPAFPGFVGGRAEATANIQAERISLFGSATSGFDEGFGNLSSASGQLGFDLSTASALRFSFADLLLESFGIANLSLFKDSPTGASVLQCAFSPFPPGGFCSQNLDVSQGPANGVLNLDAGHYELVFAAQTGVNAGSRPPGQFSFSLTPVPVPAAIWLLGSALLGFAPLLRRRRAA
jgi:hypothetical protein